jgi:hypothetical protein
MELSYEASIHPLLGMLRLPCWHRAESAVRPLGTVTDARKPKAMQQRSKLRNDRHVPASGRCTNCLDETDCGHCSSLRIHAAGDILACVQARTGITPDNVRLRNSTRESHATLIASEPQSLDQTILDMRRRVSAVAQVRHLAIGSVDCLPHHAVGLFRSPKRDPRKRESSRQ